MDKALLDTDIFSEVLKGVNAAVTMRAAAYHAALGHYTTSLITVLEVVKGYHKVNREDRIQRFLSILPTVELLPLDLKSAETAGRILGDLERTGQPIGRADPIIAAIALQYDLILVTGNTLHYQRIQGLGYPLKLDNWKL
jgi:tRNA(fMet)-specific endonuclease VapC